MKLSLWRIAGIGYLANIFVTAIPSAMASRLFPYVMLPAGVAEIAFALWVLVVGVNVKRVSPTGRIELQ